MPWKRPFWKKAEKRSHKSRKWGNLHLSCNVNVLTSTPMKRSLSRHRCSKLSGFTLVELLVVIGIIAILAGVLLSASGMAFRAAQRAKAAVMASQIQTACMGYYTEYSVYPVPTGTTVDTLIGDTSATDGASWALLIDALCGNISPSTGAPVAPTTIGNSRYQAFLNLKSTDVFTAASKTTTTPNAVVDAPMNPLPSSKNPATSIYFNIAFDSDYSGVMGNGMGTPASAITGASATTGLPNFAKSTTGAMDWTGTSTAGIAVWANCNGNTTAASQNPNFYVHTF